MPRVSLFSVMAREHTYTGRFYDDVVEAGSCEQALQLAAAQATAPKPPPGSGQPSFTVTVAEQAYGTGAGRFYDDVVEAGSCEQALQLAAGRASRLPGAAWFGAAARRRGSPQVCRCLGPLRVALRTGGGTRSAAHGRRTRLLAPGEVGQTTAAWRMHCPSQTSARSDEHRDARTRTVSAGRRSGLRARAPG